MKNLKKMLSIVLALAMVISMAACGKTEEPAATTTEEPTTTETPTDPAAEVEEAEYTYNLADSATPLNWNPHAWEMNSDDILLSYCTPGLIDLTIAEDGVNFEWVYEMATAVDDITDTFADKAKWGIEDGETGRVYRITLNPDCTWQDGTKIDANDYVYSMQQLLAPEMMNYRANSYYTGSDTAIVGAKAYMYSGKIAHAENAANAYYTMEDLVKGEDGVYTTPDGGKVYFAVGYALDEWLGGDTLYDYVDAYGEDYFDVTTWDELVALMDEEGLVPLTDESYELFAPITTNNPNWGETEDDLPAYMIYDEQYPEVTWDTVGLYAEDDYTLIYINENPVTKFYMLTSLTSNWLVYEPLYEAGKSQVEGLVATTYATDLATTISCGPYKLVNFEKDKQYVLEKNENWYGWTDGKHEGQYQTTRIIYNIITDENTKLEMFLKGDLDDIELTSDQTTTYRMSDNLYKTDQTYTFRYIFASDLNALAALEDEANDGANKKVLYYDEFREAISLSMDRARFCKEASPAYKPAYYLLNYLYYYDIENNSESQYRNTTEAKEAVLRLYGIEYGSGTPYATVDDAYNAVTGYDVPKAKELFQKVYEQAIADGNYTDGQEIHITCMCSAASTLSSDDTMQQNLLNDFVAEATKGTGFEGKITFTFTSGSTSRYDDVALGRVEMIRGAWGGAAFYPFSTIRVYCSPDYMGGLAKIHESCGWDPSKETLVVKADLDGDGVEEETENTFAYWGDSINDANLYANDPDLCMTILSQLESGILATYQCIPWGMEILPAMYSKKVEFATYDYNIMYGYGGIRLMTYNYTDAEWADYVASQGGSLNYE